MSSFPSRPFPPHSLSGIPLEYILDQLHNLAPHYWNEPESADCTIVIPVPFKHASSTASRASYDPSGTGRRVTEPSLNLLPRITLKLHSDYLSAHSSFLRALFAGASPLDLVDTVSSTTPRPSSPSHHSTSDCPSTSRYTIPHTLLPRVLANSTPDHPVIFLPIPDPSSIDLVIHWIYFGRTEFIEKALNNGDIEWEGIARNVEYLGLSTDIKVFLGWWYGRWRHSSRSSMRYAYPWDRYPHIAYSIFTSACRGEEIEYDDSDTACSDEDDSEGDDTLVNDDSASETAEETGHSRFKIEALREEPQRGRSRTTKGLSWPLHLTEQQANTVCHA